MNDQQQSSAGSARQPDCYNCKHAGCDPDGPFCGHPESFKQTMFGRGFNMMRNTTLYPETAVCGLDGKLFQPKETIQCP